MSEEPKLSPSWEEDEIGSDDSLPEDIKLVSPPPSPLRRGGIHRDNAPPRGGPPPPFPPPGHSSVNTCASVTSVIPMSSDVMKMRIASFIKMREGHASKVEATLEAFKAAIRATVVAKIEKIASYASDDRPFGHIWDPVCMNDYYGQYESKSGIPGHRLMAGWSIDHTGKTIRRPFDEVVDEFSRVGWILEDISDRGKDFRIVWRISMRI
jgi:hypothetical protein